MKRLILIGIPCLPEAWHKIFPIEKNVQQKIVPFIDILVKNSGNGKKFSGLVHIVFDIIQAFLPDQIIMHDIGVTIGILSLKNFMKKCKNFRPSVIIFNGAFGHFDTDRANHVLRIQNMSYSNFECEVNRNGGEIDPRYRDHYGLIKEFYKELAEINKANDLKIKNNSVVSRIQVDLEGKVLIIGSRNDPYIYFECLEQLESNIQNSCLKIIDYGHFPYAGNTELIKNEIDTFNWK